MQSSSKKPNIKLLSGRVPRGRGYSKCNQVARSPTQSYSAGRGQRLQQVQSSGKKPNTKLLSGESATGVEATAS